MAGRTSWLSNRQDGSLSHVNRTPAHSLQTLLRNSSHSPQTLEVSSIYSLLGVAFTVPMLFLLFLSLVSAQSQICISDYDCSSQERCLPYSNSEKRCLPREIGGPYITSPAGYSLSECFLDSDCQPSQVCIVSPSGDRTCNNRAQEASCFNDKDCGPRGACTRQENGAMRCQMMTGGVVSPPSSIGSPCRRDSDCGPNLQCVSRNGVQSCLVVTGNVIPQSNACETSLDCPRGENCVYSVGTGNFLCMNTGEPNPVVGGQVTSPGPQIGNIGLNNAYDQGPNRETAAQFENFQMDKSPDSLLMEPNSTIIPTYDVIRKQAEAPRHPVIDPAALPCQFDYQCRMGEACSGQLHLVDRNITVCQYDIMKPNRTCFYHSDCISGQRCEEVAKGELFVCRASPLATLGDTPCIFDYECSGGEQCVNVGNGTTKAFRCRPPKFADPRRNRHCRTNGDCPFQQVCRQVAEIAICVDVGSAVSSAGTEEIQKKIVDFVQNLLFARV